ETDMTRGRIDRFWKSGGRTIAAAVVGRTEMRPAFQHLAWNSHVGLAWIVARVLAATTWIARDAAGLLRLFWMLGLIPVRRPFPDVADHVVEAVAVGIVGTDRRRALVAVARGIAPREFTLPRVGHVPIVGKEFVAPCVVHTIKSATRGKFPLGFGWQRFPFPLRKRLGIRERDVHDGMVVSRVDRTAGSLRMTPLRATHELPPVADIGAIDWSLWLHEYE